MTRRGRAAAAWWCRWAGLSLVTVAACQAPAATVSTPMEVSAQPPAVAGGAGRTLDKALTGGDSGSGSRNLDMALDLQRADLAARNRPGAGAGPVARSATTPQPGQNATPALVLPPPTAGNGMPAALSLGGLSGNDAGLASPSSSGRDADQRWSNAQGNTARNTGGNTAGNAAGSGAPVPSDLAGARRLAAGLRDFLLEWRVWLLGGVALAVVVAGLTQLVRTGARHRTGQNAIEQVAQRAGHRSRSSSSRSSSSRSGSRRG